jgi:hypothetical protein
LGSLSTNRDFRGIIFLTILTTFILLEIFGHIIERGIGYYLKWENHNRPQLGRIWERDRENIVAQKKIKSLLTNLDLQEQSADSHKSFKALFESLAPSSPLLIDRSKFLKLYYDFPGQWASKIISSYELIEIDSDESWDRVLLTRFGQWITISFIDGKNFPIREIFLSRSKLFEVQSSRTVKRGPLEESGFKEDWIFPIKEFLQILQTLDPAAQEALFPDPQWFLGKSYHIKRVGLIENPPGYEDPQPVLFGVEYKTEFFTETLLIPVPREIANNMLSLIERTTAHTPEFSIESPLETPLGEIF